MAGFLGLIVFLVITGRLQTAFRRLTVAFRKTADGELTDPLPITSQDEIGDLTDSFNHMVEQLKSKEKLREAFGQFLDPRIVANVVDPSTGELKEVAERRRVTIFFSDIANFSTIGEQLTAASLVKLLNRYFTVSTQAVRRHHGIVDKFIGDAVMAFWASPFSEGESHARDGCFACLDLLESFVKVRGEIPDLTGLRRNAPRFHVRMALATGDTVIGTVGSDTTKSFTVIGDTVNTASRLEGVNKIYGTSVLLNEECYRLAESHIEAREIDLVTVLGKAEPVRIYELLGRVGSLDGATQRLANLYADSLQLYREQQWEEATKAFQECLRIRPDDGPSLEFLTRIPALKKNAPRKTGTACGKPPPSKSVVLALRSLKIIPNGLGDLFSHPFHRRQFLKSGPRNPVHRPEYPQKGPLTNRTYPRNRIQLTLLHSSLHQKLVISVGHPVGLVPDPL